MFMDQFFKNKKMLVASLFGLGALSGYTPASCAAATELLQPSSEQLKQAQSAGEHYINVIKRFCLARKKMQEIVLPFFLALPEWERNSRCIKIAHLCFVGLDGCTTILTNEQTGFFQFVKRNLRFLETLEELASSPITPGMEQLLKNPEFIKIKDEVIALYKEMEVLSTKDHRNSYQSDIFVVNDKAWAAINEITDIQTLMRIELKEQAPLIEDCIRVLEAVYHV